MRNALFSVTSGSVSSHTRSVTARSTSRQPVPSEEDECVSEADWRWSDSRKAMHRWMSSPSASIASVISCSVNPMASSEANTEE